MKRIAIGLVASLALAACGGGGVSQATASPVKTTAAPTPSPTPTPQTTFVFTADLKPSEEVPPVAGSETSCGGKVTVTVNATDKSAKFELELKGCPADTEMTAAHLHPEVRGKVAPPKIPAFAAADLKLTAGAVTVTKTNTALEAADVASIIATPASWYFNAHSKVNPGGVSRGQLEKKI